MYIYIYIKKPKTLGMSSPSYVMLGPQKELAIYS